MEFPYPKYIYKDNEYLYMGDENKVLQRSKEITFIFDKDTGTAFAHGDPLMYGEALNIKYNNCKDIFGSCIVMITFNSVPVEEVNKCIHISGYMRKFYEKYSKDALL